MLEFPTGILAHLERAGSVVTPSAQRAAALRLAHSARMLASGQRVWSSPDILPWSAWIERELGRARARGEALPRRLSPGEQWQLWREAVLRAAAGLNILAPERLLDPVRRALELMDDYGLHFAAGGSAEAALLLAARDHFRSRCSELGALSPDSWADCADWLRPSGELMLAGFTALGPARQRWLEQHGVQIHEPQADAHEHAQLRVHSAAGLAGEAQAAADWCAERLRRDAGARLLVIVPRLAELRHHWQRAFSQRLEPLRVLAAGQNGAARSSFAIEGGRALREHPLVLAALGVIGFGTGRIELEGLLALLRSPYLRAGELGARLRLELWLRENGLEPVTLETLLRSRAAIESDAGEGTGTLLLALQAALPGVGSAGAPARQSRAEQFAEWLERCGWPGEDLGSDEQQVRARFEALLGELAALESGARPLAAGEAAALLEELALREHFEPASDDVAVTLTASLDDPIVHYDGLWVAGLSADAWPRPVQSDALIPATVQRLAGLPGCTPAQTLAEARALQGLWPQRARECVLSWAQTEEDLRAEPSPLLQGLPPARVPPSFELPSWLAGLRPPREVWQEHRGVPWPDRRELRGGAKLLELQALCAFRGYAELRLSARELGVSERGVAALERGRMLHRALQLFWQQIGSSEALKADAAAAQAWAQQCAARALQEAGAAQSGPLAALLLERERERTQALLMKIIDWERSRAPFRVQQLEWATGLMLAGHRLPLRLDRVDRLQDGRLLVLDYKSGRVQSFDAYAERPTQPQLAAYALALGEEVAGVAMLYVGRDTIGVRGLADRAGRLAKLRAVPEALGWGPLQGQWRQRLELLAAEFVAGHAAIEPQPRACERCHLQILCRVDALTQERARDRAELRAEERAEEASGDA